jgi:hypothetical protein
VRWTGRFDRQSFQLRITKEAKMITTTPRVEEHRTKGERLVARVRELIREGNVRRIIVKNEEGRTLVELPMTVGVVGALLAPAWAALGAIAAVVTDCSIEVERYDDETTAAAPPEPETPVTHESREAALLDAKEDDLHVDRQC